MADMSQSRQRDRSAASPAGVATRSKVSPVVRADPGMASSSRSGQLPAGDVRLTANIRADLHLKLKIRAAQERTTMGELIEAWIERW